MPMPHCNAYHSEPQRNRLQEHKSDTKLVKTKTNGIAPHVWEKNHCANWDNTKGIAIEQNMKKGEIREALEMTQAQDTVYSKPSAYISNFRKPLLSQSLQNREHNA